MKGIDQVLMVTNTLYEFSLISLKASSKLLYVPCSHDRAHLKGSLVMQRLIIYYTSKLGKNKLLIYLPELSILLTETEMF